ncbi:hypothetical protein BC940DRAFT_345208 [Gongronella butleri]|nr:hypothetical protein BC940DRAFT_345208 [Gongronella butleri]
MASGKTPSHASTGQRSSLTIDAAAAQSSFSTVRRNKSVLSAPHQHAAYSGSPRMPQDELTSKIADSFEQFSSMLNQMQRTTKKDQRRVSRTASLTRTRPTKTNGSIRAATPESPLYPTAMRAAIVSSPQSMHHPTCLPMSPPLPHHVMAPPPSPYQTTTPSSRRIIISDAQLVRDFLAATSNGHVDNVQKMVKTCPDLLFAAEDDSLTTALMIAICFDRTQIAHWLIAQGAPLDEQDRGGWTALMWAVCLGRRGIVEELLRRGAAAKLTSMQGNTAYDLVWDADVRHVLSTYASSSRRACLANDRKLRHKKTQKSVKAARRQSTPVFTSSSAFHHSGIDAYTHFMNTEARQHAWHAPPPAMDRASRRQSSLGFVNARHGQFSVASSVVGDDDDQDTDNEINSDDDDEEDVQDILASLEASLRSVNTFDWDNCMVDQMFAFSMDDLPAILDVALTLPPSAKQLLTLHQDDTLWIPADLLFLCARFAYFYSPRHALTQFFDTTLTRLAKVAKGAKGQHALCYWLANMHVLLMYLKRDTHLVQATVAQQQVLAGMIADVYKLLVKDCARQMDRLLEPCFLDAVMDKDVASAVRFANDDEGSEWTRFFQRRSSTRLSMDTLLQGSLSATTTTTTASSVAMATMPSSSSVTSVSSSTSGSLIDGGKDGGGSMVVVLHCLDQLAMVANEILPSCVAQHLVEQCVYHLVSEAFNHVLQQRRYLSRSHAFQIRLSVSALQDWAKTRHIVSADVAGAIAALVQLLQFLQCITRLTDVNDFNTTCDGLTRLNSLHLRRAATDYRYEIDEPRVAEDIIAWLQHQATATAEQQMQQGRASTSSRTSTMTAGSNAADDTSLNATFEAQFLTFLHHGPDAAARHTDTTSLHSADAPPREWMDSHRLIAMPLTASSSSVDIEHYWTSNGASESMYHQLKAQAKRDKKTATMRIPCLSHKFIEKLDKKLHK